MAEENIILYDSPEAAQIKTVTGWVSRNGFFWGIKEGAEDRARYEGCTHVKCKDCGNVINRNRTTCLDCLSKKDAEKYKAKIFQEWDRVTPLCIYGTDIYFFDADSIAEYAEEHEVLIETLELMICKPMYATPIDYNDHYNDILPQDIYVEDIDEQLSNMFHAINEYIAEKKPILSWFEGEFRTTLKLQGD